MTPRIVADFEVLSDFHIGSGAGVGRTIDAVFLRDAGGFPLIPGSSIKGLARWHARFLCRMHSGFAPNGLEDPAGPLAELFGLPGGRQGQVDFGNAKSDRLKVAPPVVRSRSGRDRTTGTTAKDVLFRVEDASSGRFRAEITFVEPISQRAMVLLLCALRRIEALGARRNRGKGDVRVRLRVEGTGTSLDGRQLPGDEQFKTLIHETLESGAAGAGMETTEAAAGKRAADPAAGAAIDQADKNSCLDTSPAVLIVLARAEGPLCFPPRPEVGYATTTIEYVPGTTLRGALAARALRGTGNTADDEFLAIFARDDVTFGPLYALGERPGRGTLSFPVPASLVSCKLYPGARSRDREAHGCRETLYDEERKDCGRNLSAGADVTEGERIVTPPCDAPFEPAGGYARVAEQDPLHAMAPVMELVPVHREVRVRTAVDETTLRGQDEQLYATELLPEGLRFGGFIRGPRNLLDELRRRIGAQDEQEIVVAVGRARTRGQGRLSVRLLHPPKDADAEYPGLKAPAEGGPQAAGKNAAADPPPPAAPPAVFLYSDVIGFDRFLRPITRLDAPSLWALLGGSGTPPFDVPRAFATTRTVATFNSIPGLPRTRDIALCAGSVARLRWRADAGEQQKSAALDLLARAQAGGLGVRRGEGFGRVVLDHALRAAATADGTAPGPLDETRNGSLDENADYDYHGNWLGDAGWKRLSLAGGYRWKEEAASVRKECARTGAGIVKKVRGLRAGERETLARLFRALATTPDPADRIQWYLDRHRQRQGKRDDPVKKILEAAKRVVEKVLDEPGPGRPERGTILRTLAEAIEGLERGND